MPTYEYKCKSCGYKFEKFHSMTAASIKKCPECGKRTVERLIGTGAALIFKGSGFYITDYRDASYAEKAKADAAPAKTESDSSSTGADAKPAAAETKAEAKTESKTDAKAEAKPAAKTESAPAKAESKPSAKSSSAKRSNKSGK
ncbi:MAG TPA: zinc ribbon domain-containing protein [Tepidisphaeraceae bacterium]|jgi:putative FmdB family regulatory protein|nr:zinc ribbon domain-containing protein [Tepidisphaeraceae bacterium]